MLLNGAREFIPTLIALHTLSDLARTKDSHHPEKALRQAAEAVCGSNWQVVHKIAQSVGPHELCFPHTPCAGPLERAVEGLPVNRRLAALLDVLGEFAGIAAALNRAAETDPRLLELQETALRLTDLAHHLAQVLRGKVSKLPRSNWRTALDPYLKPARRNVLLTH